MCAQLGADIPGPVAGPCPRPGKGFGETGVVLEVLPRQDEERGIGCFWFNTPSTKLPSQFFTRVVTPYQQAKGPLVGGRFGAVFLAAPDFH